MINKLQINFFSGSLDFTTLPTTLRELRLEQNRFSGLLDFCSMPNSLTAIDLSYNAVHGCVELSLLPPNVEWINFSESDVEILNATGLRRTFGKYYSIKVPTRLVGDFV